MASDYSFKFRLLDQLSEIYKLTTELRSKEESICSDARQVLKPWPKKKASREKESKTEKNSGDVQEDKVIPAAPEVMLVEKALAKAHRTRNKFPYKILLDAKDVQQEIQSQNSENRNIVTDEVQEEKQTCKDRNKLHANNFTSSPNEIQQNSALTDSDFVAFITETKLKNLLISSDKRKNPLVSNKRDQPYTKSAPLVKDGVTISSAQAALGKKQFNGSRNYTPAHASAPFQTKSITKKVKPGQTRTQMLRANANSKKSSVEASKNEKQTSSTRVQSGNHMIGSGLQNHPSSGTRVKSGNHMTGKSLQNQPRTEKFSVSHQSKQISQTSQLRDANKCEVESIMLNPLLNERFTRNNTVEVRHGQQVLTEVSKSGVLEHRHDSQFMNINNNANGNNPTEEEVRFILQRDGNKMSVPLKLSKLLSNNRRMREKLKSVGITKKTQDGVSAADSFMNKMQNYFAQGFSGEEYSKLLKVQALCDTYQSLSMIFVDICKKPLTDSSNVREVLRGKRGMEYVLLNFAEIEEEFQILCSDFNTTGKSQTRRELLTKKEPSRIFCLPRKYIPDSLSLSSKIKYQSKTQLMEYTSILHQLQFLLLQNFVIAEISREVLPLLHHQTKNNQTDWETVDLYRTVYSLLCCNGKTFPVMVQDEDCDASSDCDEDFQHDDNFDF